MLYQKLLRPLLFHLEAEQAHHFTLATFKNLSRIPGAQAIIQSLLSKNNPALKTEAFGLKFPNPVGLAAGFDKNAAFIDELAILGFGYIEIGTVTPKPQPGNDKPRLFRLPKDQAIINRMGFNNDGVDVVVERLKKTKSKIIVGGNIGKNKITPNENAIDDYEICFEKLFDHVDYFVVNVSSPNTPGLRELQEKEPLTRLLNRLQNLNQKHTKAKPLLLKIAPDLTESQLDDIAAIAKDTQLSGLIATNTTISRDHLKTTKVEVEAIGAGGLSGQPLTEQSTDVIKHLRERIGDNIPLIGVGGIMRPEDATHKFEAGAKLVQIYSGFIYSGPGLVKGICRQLTNSQKTSH